MKPWKIGLWLALQGPVCHRQWTHQLLHGHHQVLKKLPDVWGWLNQAGVSRQQVPDAGDVVCCCSAHKLGPGAHKLIFHVGEKRLLSELQPDPAQCSTKVICIYVVAGVGLGHQRRCIQNLHSTVHHAQCCTYI